jgi:hypothetical protein
MSHFTDEASMEETIDRLVRERFGPNEEPLDEETFIEEIFYYHDVRQVLTAQDLVEKLRSVSSSAEDSSQLVERLSTLNQQVEGLRTILMAAQSDKSPDEAAAALSRSAFLTELDAARLKVIIQLYSDIIENIDDPDDIDYADIDEAALFRCITEELITQYLDDLYKSRRWLQPVETLFNTGQMEQLFEQQGPGFLPKDWIRCFFDQSHYQVAIERFERLHEPFLADVTRVFLSYALYMQDIINNGNYPPSAATETRAVLDRLDRYDLIEWAAFGDAKGFILVIPGILRLMLGSHPSLPASDRSRDLLKAEASFEASGVLQFKPFIPLVRWMRSELADGTEREKLAASAFARVNELLAQTALEKEPLARLGTMTSLMMLPAGWKYAKGDFRGAIEASAMAKSMAEAFNEEFDRELRPTLEEIQKAIVAEEGSPEERAQLVNLRDSLLPLLEGTKSLAFLADLTRLASEASLAEANGDFVEAAQLYREASAQEKEALDRLISMMSIFIDKTAAISRASQQGFQHQARAAYFNAMAKLNEGDRKLMEGEYAEANHNYTDAQTSFKAAEELWTQELLRISQTSAQTNYKPRDEMLVNASRARYCDAKIEISNGEQASTVLRQPLTAHNHFDKAAYILAEALGTSLSKESRRGVSILRASEDFCQGRALLELDIADSKLTNSDEGTRLLDSAATLFEQIGEGRWASYIRGVLYEYEAVIFRQLARVGGSEDPNTYVMRAQLRASDAAAQFRQLGLESRAMEMEYLARRSTQPVIVMQPVISSRPALALPKPPSLSPISTPTEALVEPAGPSEKKLDDIRLDQALTKLKATVIVHSKRLDELGKRRDSGFLEEGRYSELASHYDTERMEQLLKMRELLGGQGKDIDGIIQAASDGAPLAQLIARITNLAREKNLDPQIVNELGRDEAKIYR